MTDENAKLLEEFFDHMHKVNLDFLKRAKKLDMNSIDAINVARGFWVDAMKNNLQKHS